MATTTANGANGAAGPDHLQQTGVQNPGNGTNYPRANTAIVVT